MNMMIRQARREDLPSINEIYNQAVVRKFCTAHLVPVSLEQRENWFRAHDAKRFPVFVVQAGEDIAGWISLSPYREERQALNHVSEVSYYVHEAHQGRGIGGQMLRHAISVAPAYGFSVLIAILLDRNFPSIALLEKHGFEKWGSMPGIAQIGSSRADHLYYGLKL